MKHSSSSLFSYLKALPDSGERLRICDTILTIFEEHLYDSRVIVPLFGFLDRLLGSSVVRDVLDADDSRFPAELMRLAKLEVSKTKDYRKLVSNIDVFCQLVQVGESFIEANILRAACTEFHALGNFSSHSGFVQFLLELKWGRSLSTGAYSSGSAFRATQSCGFYVIPNGVYSIHSLL